MNFKLLASPLQGFTDFRFRNAFNKYFGGIDTFYAPYIRIKGKLQIRRAYQQDIDPENNSSLKLIPQIMTNNAEEFIFVAKHIQQLGYKELNWNLGCPYPMVTKRGMGSGLINDPEKIDSILKKVHAESEIIVSVKMRLGYEKHDEILRVLPVLNNYPIKNIAIHPRLGKQLYKGDVDLDSFQRCIDNTDHILYYNGDIASVANFNEMAKRFPTIDHWMLGRGLIADPFLPGMIKNNTSKYPKNRIKQFRKFHDTLLHDYAEALSGASHILMRMFTFWEYFITSFPKSQKRLVKIKRTKNIDAYEKAVSDILDGEL
ncbi:tRNA-dihydrouridine synthase family protein [bacterium]|nr:tRNA-dihydrouridine synthase family protein [bacterium]